MIGRYVLREVVEADTDQAGARVYRLECGHMRRVFPAPAKDSVRSRCHACAGDTPAVSAGRASAAAVPTARSVQPSVPAIVYQVREGLWRAECPFLSFRPCVHGPSAEEAEAKLQAAIDAAMRDLHAPGVPDGSRFFTVTA